MRKYATCFSSLALATLVITVFSLTSPQHAHARWMVGGDGIAVIWVNVAPKRGETLWQTCRRIYQRDAYMAQHGRKGKVRCLIDSSRIYADNPARQNFNR